MGARRSWELRARRLVAGVVVSAVAALGCSAEGSPEPAASGGAGRTTTTDGLAAALERLAEMEAAGLSPEEIEAALAALDEGGAPPPPGTGPIVGVFGDSSALTLALGLDTYGVAHPDVLYVDGGATAIGCGLVPEGDRRYREQVLPLPEECRTWLEDWRAGVAATEMDIALVQLGPWEVADTAPPGGEQFAHIGQPAFDAQLRALLDAGFDALAEAGVLVVACTSPTFTVAAADGSTPDRPFPESDPARVARWNELLREAVAARPGQAVILDLGGYLDGLTPAEDDRLRPDGIHLTPEGAEEVAGDWLAAEIRRVWEAHTG